MKSIFLLSALLSSAFAACDPESVLSIPDGVSKLTVTGFADPVINYFSAIAGMVSTFMNILLPLSAAFSFVKRLAC